MQEIIQFQLKDSVVDITPSKIVHSHYEMTTGILEIIFDGGEQLALKINFDQFQQYDAARTKLVIIEDSDDFH
jgi:hypothetical protein